MLHTLELGSDIICYTHLDESHFWCFHIIQDFYKIICDPPPNDKIIRWRL